MQLAFRLAILVLVSSLAFDAWAAPPATPGKAVFSRYEEDTIAMVLDGSKDRVDPDPEGKTIAAISVVALDVIDPRDPAPRFLNVAHATTRKYVVRREMLLHVGDRYRQDLVDESVRNLRTLQQLSLVVAVPLATDRPDQVRIVVITKDVWSLRLNWNVSATRGGLESLLLQPSETNFLGTHQVLSGLFMWQPESSTFGLSYTIPRIEGSRLQLTASANLIVNRDSGSPEGSYGGLVVSQPLFSSLTEWAWDGSVAWRSEITRRYVDARLSTFDAKVTPENDRIPFAYDTQTAIAQYSATRSFGVRDKSDVSAGVLFDKRKYRTPDLEGFDPSAVAEFVRTKVPVSDARLGPFLQLHSYTSRFARVLDMETLALQEDYRLGHEVYLRVYPVLRALGSSRDFFGVLASAQYTLALGDGILRGSLESMNEAEVDRLADASLTADLRVVTPSLGFGRFVYDARLIDRYRNYLNRSSQLGGNTRLRGYPTNFFVGRDILASNLEYRTPSLQVFTIQLGGAAFYDVGDAFDGFSDLHPKQALGTGFRVLFPQFDRTVFRADLGFPVGSGARALGVSPVSFFVTFEQAFPVPTLTAAALPSGPTWQE